MKYRKMKRPRTPSRKSTPKAAAPPGRAPTYDDLLAIARLIESGSRFSEFRLRSGDIEVEVKRANGAVIPMQPAPERSNRGKTGIQPEAGASIPGPPVAAAPGVAAARVTDVPPGSHVIKSPMVGTFYRAPEPGAPPFVEVGAQVEADTIVCIIEVMKLLNSVTAGVAGVVTHVLVDNGGMVEFGQPLVAIRTHR
jgi:acetyl-CoA carboxylase biotin carboxyl carrier protein